MLANSIAPLQEIHSIVSSMDSSPNKGKIAFLHQENDQVFGMTQIPVRTLPTAEQAVLYLTLTLLVLRVLVANDVDSTLSANGL